MSSIFSKIISGEIPSYKIAENENCLAFLDINPLHEGHVLVIPKEEVDYIFDMPKDKYQELQNFAYEVSNAIKLAIPCAKIGVAVIGLEVPHAHIHLVPINNVHDLNFSKPKLSFTPAQFETTAQKIKQHLL